MKSLQNFTWGLIGFAVVVTAGTILAADLITTYPLPVPANNSYVPPDYSRPASVATSTSNAMVVAWNAQVLMLKEMLHEHLSRAAELTQKNQSQKAKWESELVNELQEKLGRAQKRIDEMSQPGAENLKPAGGDADDEVVFVSTVEARLGQIHEDLSTAIADSRVLSVQVATNKAPDVIAGISVALGDNQRLVKELQREQLDLDLRKLEFRAIRKAMQK